MQYQREAIRLLYSLFVAVCLTNVASAPEPLGRTNKPTQEQLDQRIRLALNWLLQQQSSQGSWNSATYGQMRTGAANTALIVNVIASLPEQHRQYFGAERLQSGLKFLTASIDQKGFVRAGPHTTDYPTYATALTLSALKRINDPAWDRPRAILVKYLVSAQQTEVQGNSPNDPDYGGWDQTGGPDIAFQSPVKADIAVTSLVLEALHDELHVDLAVFERAKLFLSRCQNYKNGGDGGFFFTTADNDPRNKAGVFLQGNLSTPRSYGTATVDGIRAMTACGIPTANDNFQSATDWLTQHADVATVPGFVDEEARRTWAIGLRFYYWAGLSKVLPLLPRELQNARRDDIWQALTVLQQPNGSWLNPSHAMREDDPLIATALAIETLENLKVLVDSERDRDQ